MSKKIIVTSEIPLSGTKNGAIQIGELLEPYGANSQSVVSIAISLDKEDTDWKVHIPFENLDEVIQSLEKMRK